MFIVKYDSGGNVLCAAALSSGGDDRNGICADLFRNVYITSDFLADPFIIGNDTLPLTGGESVFTSKFTCEATYISELNNTNSELSIYPVPFTTQFEIRSPQSGEKEIIISDIFGRIVYSQKFLTARTLLHSSNWQKGIYFLRVTVDQKQYVRKIVKD
jgi:hypothetical protein